MTDKPDIPDIAADTVAHNGNLRDRIAAAIYSTPPVWDQFPWDDLTDDARQVFREQADAVIAALGLQPETLYYPGGAVLTRLDGKVLADNRYMTRWATPWEPDESPVK